MPTEPQPIPPDLGDVYEEITNDVSILHANWAVYCHLFAAKDVIDLMNELCSFAARTIQNALLDSVLLQITRLTDPSESRGGKDRNLTLERLIGELANPPQDLIDDLTDRLAEIRTAVEPFREHRNKRIAHPDLDHALADFANLPPFSRKSIEDSLSELRDFMNAINNHYRFGPTSYELTQVRGGGDDLVRVFKMAQRLQQLQDAAWDPNGSMEQILHPLKFDVL